MSQFNKSENKSTENPYVLEKNLNTYPQEYPQAQPYTSTIKDTEIYRRVVKKIRSHAIIFSILWLLSIGTVFLIQTNKLLFILSLTKSFCLILLPIFGVIFLMKPTSLDRLNRYAIVYFVYWIALLLLTIGSVAIAIIHSLPLSSITPSLIPLVIVTYIKVKNYILLKEFRATYMACENSVSNI